MLARRTLLAGGLAGAGSLILPRALAQSGPAWTEGPPLPMPLQEIYAALHEGEIWVAGGFTMAAAGGLIVSSRTFALDPVAGTWREGPRLGEPMHHPQLVSAGGSLFAIGGFRTSDEGVWSMRDNFEMLDGDQWTAMPALPMPLAESHAGVIGGRVHVIGGRTPAGEANAQWNDHRDTGRHFVFDFGAERWLESAPLPVPRNSGAAIVHDAAIIVIGGRTVDGGNLPNVERFEPGMAGEPREPFTWYGARGEEAGESLGEEFNGWTRLPDMPEARGGIAAALLGDRVHVFGGEFFGPASGGVYGSVLTYDPGSEAWSESGEMPTPRHGLAAVETGGKIVTIGGATLPGANGTSSTVELFR